MVRSVWDFVARYSGEEESATTWHRTSAGGIRRIRSSASSLRATNCSGPARSSTRCVDTSRSLSRRGQRWLAQYGGMKANEAKRLKELEAENARLKKLVANQALDIDMLKEMSAGKF